VLELAVGFRAVVAAYALLGDGEFVLGASEVLLALGLVDAVEAAMAGGLGVQLGGTNFYDSVAVEKPFIGQAAELLNIKHIRQSVMIAYVSSTLMLITGVIFFKGG